MKAMALTGIRRLEPLEVPDPSIARDTDVLVRIRAVGICGSDLHYFKEGRIGDQVIEFPYTVGHECAGVVEEVGRAVTALKRGDRVAIDPAMPCWHCDQCRDGRHHTCRALRFLGCPGQAPGCLSERLILPETSCFPIPESTTFERAVISEPLAIGIYGVRKSMPIKGKRIGILGAGPIGMSVLLGAKVKGAQGIYVTDKIDGRLAMARGVGATWTGNPVKEDVVRRIAEREPEELDAVFECCGQQEALDQGVTLLKPGGKLMILGIPAVERISFDVDDTRRKEICIQHVRRQVGCTGEALEGIRCGDYDVDFMITHRFPFERAQEAFDLVAGYRGGVLKAVVEL